MPSFVTSDEVKLSYADEGSGSSIVFVHGWTASKLSFQLVSKDFADKYRVITYDHRGHGESEIPEHGLTLSRLATDLEELLMHLNLDKIILVGWSMGAHVLFEYVKKYGCNRLKAAVIVDMSPKIINDNGWRMGIYGEDYSYSDGIKELVLMCDNWDDYIENYLIPQMSPPLKPGKPNYEVALKLLQDNAPHVMYALWGSLMAADYREVIKDITVPTLIMYGMKSSLYKAEVSQYLHDNIPQSSLVGIPKSGHTIPLDQPKLFSQAILAFIREWSL